MASTSTVPTVKRQLVDQIGAKLSVPVTYAWPGPDTLHECVFLGPHPATADIRLEQSSQIPTIKSGRKDRDEEYTVRVTVWSFRPDLTSTGAEECETGAFAILAPIEDLLADDPRIGLPNTVVRVAQIESVASTLFPFKKGWACEIAVDVNVKARLQ